MADKPYKIERVPAGHFILYIYGMPLDDETLNKLRRVDGVTNVTPPARDGQHVIDVSREAIQFDKISGRVRGRLKDVLNAYYHL